MPTLLALLFLLFQAPQGQQVTASIEGIVVKLGTGEPVARARVVVTKADGAATPTTFTTDGTGRFSFRNLPPGRYRLFANREGYVRAEYGQRSPSRPGTPITLAGSQEMKDVTLGLTPTGAISGRVYDRYGDPVVNANVQALRNTYVDGRRIFAVAQSVRTNDLGEYRLYWMQPGKYVVSAMPQEGTRLDGGSMVLEVGPGSPIQLNGGAPAGAIRIGGNAAAVSGVVASDTTYLPVYFPGTTDPSAAAPIDLPPGINFTGVDLLTVETRSVHVRGRIVSSASGQLPRVSIQIVARRNMVVGAVSRSTVVSPDGSFDFSGIGPGSYDLVASANPVDMRIPAGPAQFSPGGGVEGRLTARVPIEVGNADVDNVTVALQPGVGVSGRLIIEGLQPSEYPGNLRVDLRFDPPIVGPSFPPSGGSVGRDGTFTIAGVGPGTYRVTVGNLPPKAYLKSNRLGGAEALNSGLRIDGKPQGELEIRIGLNPGTFEAGVQNERQEAAANVTVVLVPDVARRHRPDSYITASTDAAGRVRVERIPPGDYKVFAWEDVEAGAWQDPGFIQIYENRGQPIRVLEGSAATAELRLIPSQ